MDCALEKELKNDKINLLRSSFSSLCREFPSLSLSITHSDESSQLNIRDDKGSEHVICLETLLNDTRHGIYDIILSIKETLKLYDS
jgi:hypothetical protein